MYVKNNNNYADIFNVFTACLFLTYISRNRVTQLYTVKFIRRFPTPI